MAKISIEYDTKEKTLSATMDGKKLPNLSQIMIYNYPNRSGEDDAHIELTSVIGNEDEGMYERHCIYASTEEKTKISKDDIKKDKKKKKKKQEDMQEDDAYASIVAGLSKAFGVNK